MAGDEIGRTSSFMPIKQSLKNETSQEQLLYMETKKHEPIFFMVQDDNECPNFKALGKGE